MVKFQRKEKRNTHSRICLRVEIFQTYCQYKVTIDSPAQFFD